MAEKPSCENCRYLGERGLCLRHPPTRSGERWDPYAVFPVIPFPDETWCGEHEDTGAGSHRPPRLIADEGGVKGWLSEDGIFTPCDD